MKKVILIGALILTSFSLLSFDSLNNKNFKSKDVKNLIIVDECQDYVGSIITGLYENTDMSMHELADYETFLFGSCYYDA